MTRPGLDWIMALVLIAGIVATGVALVETTHQSRSLFRELEALKREQDRLLDDWSALTIEVSTLADPARIDAEARQSLGLVEPDARIEFVEVGP